MNLPNKLTVLRVIMIPFFVVSLLAFHGEVRLLRNLAAAIFIVASLSDMLDGTASVLDGHYHRQPGIHHQRLPPHCC